MMMMVMMTVVVADAADVVGSIDGTVTTTIGVKAINPNISSRAIIAAAAIEGTIIVI